VSRTTGWAFLAIFASIVAALVLQLGAARTAAPAVPDAPFHVRRLLLKEIQPIALANCELERFGEKNDGGYLVCRNLLGRVQSAYSYGISGYDGWGCDVSTRLKVPVHQYDCFNLTRPVCSTGNTIFHGECIGTRTTVEEGRPFDTLAKQIDKNGDAGKRLVVKMDVEGAEWNSFIEAPDSVLQRIDQLVVEFHGSDQPRFLTAMRKLKQLFYVAHLHWNNYGCVTDQSPFPAWAYEVLLVNKRIGVPDPSHTPALPHPLDAPNAPDRAECY
jgi:hypothetical protein